MFGDGVGFMKQNDVHTQARPVERVQKKCYGSDKKVMKGNEMQRKAKPCVAIGVRA